MRNGQQSELSSRAVLAHSHNIAQRDFDFLYILQNMLLIHCIDDIMLNELRDREVASFCSSGWETN